MGKESNDRRIFEHFQFTITCKSSDENVYALKGNDMKFPKVSKMLEYYRDDPISHMFSNIGVPVIYQTESVGATTTHDSGESDL